MRSRTLFNWILIQITFSFWGAKLPNGWVCVCVYVELIWMERKKEISIDFPYLFSAWNKTLISHSLVMHGDNQFMSIFYSLSKIN